MIIGEGREMQVKGRVSLVISIKNQDVLEFRINLHIQFLLYPASLLLIHYGFKPAQELALDDTEAPMRK